MTDVSFWFLLDLFWISCFGLNQFYAFLDVKQVFSKIVTSNPDMSAGMAAIKTLLEVLEHDKCKESGGCFWIFFWGYLLPAGTIQELDANFRNAIAQMKATSFPVTSVTSGCELFLRFITLATLDFKNFQDCKHVMMKRGQMFFEKLSGARSKVSKLASSFVSEGCVSGSQGLQGIQRNCIILFCLENLNPFQVEGCSRGAAGGFSM